MDELARALDLDPVELRRRTLIEEGAESPTRQVFGPLGIKETLERAVELIGYGAGAARRRGDRDRLRLVAVVRRRVGRVREAERRRHGDDRHRRAGERKRRRDGPAAARGRGARDAARTTSRSCTRTPTPARGTAARRARRRRSTTAARSSRRRARCASRLLELAADRLEAARERPRARRRRRAGEGRPAARRCRSRSSRGRARRSSARARGGCPRRPPSQPGQRCVGRLGFESFLEPQLITHAVHVRVDRETGVVRVLRVAAVHDSGRILNPVGA